MPQTYHPGLDTFSSKESTRETDVRHLLHMAKLAQIRLRPTLAADEDDASGGPLLFDVATKQRHNPYVFHSAEVMRDDPLAAVPGADMVHVRLRADFADPITQEMYRQRSAAAEEERRQRTAQRIGEDNQTILTHLVMAEDTKNRTLRHMNQHPTQEEVNLMLWEPRARWVAGHHEQREREWKRIAEANHSIGKALVNAGPHVPTAKKLNEWYTKEHVKRVQTLSRFKKTNNKHTASSSSSTRRGQGQGSGDVRVDYRGTCEPAFVGAKLLREYGVPGVPDTWPTNRRVAQEPLLAGSYVRHTARMNESETAQERPPWRDLTLTDIPQQNYENDLLLIYEGTEGSRVRNTRARDEAQHAVNSRRNRDFIHANKVSRVHREEEGGCTKLWRAAVEKDTRRQRSKERETSSGVSLPALPRMHSASKRTNTGMMPGNTTYFSPGNATTTETSPQQRKDSFLPHGEGNVVLERPVDDGALVTNKGRTGKSSPSSISSKTRGSPDSNAAAVPAKLSVSSLEEASTLLSEDPRKGSSHRVGADRGTNAVVDARKARPYVALDPLGAGSFSAASAGVLAYPPERDVSALVSATRPYAFM